jgi:hypothetical protein
MVKFDVVQMLTFFVSMVLPGMQYRMSGVRTGKSLRASYAEVEYLGGGLAIGLKATVSMDGSWWILSLVAENPSGKVFTMSLSKDGDTILLSREQDGFYTQYLLPDIPLDEIPWDGVQYEVEKALYKRM